MDHKINCGLIFYPFFNFWRVYCAVFCIPVYFFTQIQIKVNAIKIQITKIPTARENFPRFSNIYLLVYNWIGTFIRHN
jgi:hypothetical protein